MVARVGIEATTRGFSADPNDDPVEPSDSNQDSRGNSGRDRSGSAAVIVNPGVPAP